MNTIPTLGEIRPIQPTGDPYAEPFSTPLYALRRREWRVITPEECRVPDCPVCAWRKAGLLDTPVVREPDSGYTCHSSYCPGCNTVRCVCPPDGYEDALAEQAYQLGHEHGLVDGPENRPTRRWLRDAGLDVDPYLDGYDDGCDGLPLHTLTPVTTGPTPPVLWDDLDDGMPF
jgi:hypothetical protein